MPKINFSKVEKSFDKALQKLSIDHLSELAAIANVIQDPHDNITSKAIEDVIKRFQKELKKLKKQRMKSPRPIDVSCSSLSSMTPSSSRPNNAYLRC